MNRTIFFQKVKGIRAHLNAISANDLLDDLVELVTGKEIKMENERSIEEDMQHLLERIKNAKEKKKLMEKAKELIEELEKE